MHTFFSTLVSCAIIAVVGCSNHGPTGNLTENKSDTTLPVETRRPNSDYKPAFEGQTRVRRVVTKAPYEGRAISQELNKPWGIIALPDGRFLITEKKGTMRIATGAGQLSDGITGIPAVDSRGQGGLLGLTIDPGFANNRMVYWVFSEHGEKGTVTAVAKGKLSADNKRIENASVIYRATPYYDGDKHYGGRILFTKDGYLVVSTGERSDLETRPQAQDLMSGLGKILRITTDGKAAPGNPFEGKSNARPEIYTYGHRNVQGLAWHPVTGDLWENEFGPKGGDELNRIEPGKNYGWAVITYGLEYSGPKINGGLTQKEGLEQPVYYWDPVVSPSGMTFYTGSGMEEWKNDLFIAALNVPHLLRLVIKDNKVIGEERLLESEKQRFRDVCVGKDGALYAVTDEGRLYRVGKK